MISLLSKLNLSTDTASVASRQGTARNIVDSAVMRLQPRSHTCNDAAIDVLNILRRLWMRLSCEST